MIRKLLLPALGIALLGGCYTGYTYRPAGSGGYYYGQPSVEYRYYGGYGGYYGYGPGYYGGYYNRPYWNGYYPYYPGYPYWRPPVVVRPHDPDRPGHGDRDDHDGKPPWRNLGDIRDDNNINRREWKPPRMVPNQPGMAQPGMRGTPTNRPPPMSSPNPPRMVSQPPRPVSAPPSRSYGTPSRGAEPPSARRSDPATRER